MKNKFFLLLALASTALAVCSEARATGPSLSWQCVPPTMNVKCVSYPIAHAKKGSNNLSRWTIWYSYDNVNWTILLQNSAPNNNNQYDPSGDFMGGCVGFAQTGTMYLKSTVWDTAGLSATATTSIAITSIAKFASLLCANSATYNYGPAWMWDYTTGQRCWWTAGYPGGGDCINYAAWPLGSTTPSIVFSQNSFGNKLISNPCVIKATLNNGYQYAMYYDACRSGYPGNIEVTFSHDGNSWTAPTSIVNTQFPNSGSNAGAALGSVIRRSGSNFVMIYTDASTKQSGNLYIRTSADGITWNNAPTAVSQTGLTNFGNNLALGLGNCPSIAYRAADDSYYMAYTEVPSNTTLDVYKISAANIASGTWSQVFTLGAGDTMYYKSNPGLLRDESGFILVGGNLCVSYATSNQDTGDYDNIATSQIYYTTYPLN